MSTTLKKLHIPILYGSQTGNSQSCAESFAESLPQTLSKALSTTSSSSSSIQITSTAKQLDDFLEIDRANWPRLVVIICSSYGVGQAPIGCWKFRDVCDAILESNDNTETKLKGVTYAMLGLGDSKYTTFFLNPTALDSAMTKAGAIRIGSLGKADASGTGEKIQSKVMDKWCVDIIPDIVRFVQNELMDESEEERKVGEVALNKAQCETLALCKELFDDWEEEKIVEKSASSVVNGNILIVLVVVVAILLAAFYKGK